MVYIVLFAENDNNCELEQLEAQRQNIYVVGVLYELAETGW